MENIVASGCAALGLSLAACFATANEYLVIDVSAGKDAADYPVEKLESAPQTWSDEYKTTKIVLKKIHSDGGSFYIGVFEVTQRQWELVTGKRPSYYRQDSCYEKRPVENVSYDDIRGKLEGSKYPATTDVDLGSFVGLLRAKAKLPKLDLPTRVQWELACNEPGRKDSADNCDMIARRARIGVNCGWRRSPPPGATPTSSTDNGTAEVGSYQPNGRGLYDMHGNVLEWCLDSCDVSDDHVAALGYSWQSFRPFGRNRVLKGGHCESSAPYCRVSRVYGDVASFGSSTKGLRLALSE